MRQSTSYDTLHEQLCSFDDCYEQLIDLLCLSAQVTVAIPGDQRYREIRRLMRSRYRTLKDHLKPHWEIGTEYERDDPFDSLLSHTELEGVLSSQSSIEDMVLCRKALDSCYEHIRLQCTSA